MIYYLPKGAKTWQRLPTTRFVENLVVADLQPGAGTYAVMSTVALPALHPGWNVLTYPLPYTRPVTIALASLANLYSVIYKPDPDKLIQVRESTINAMKYNKLKTNVNVLEFGQVYWIKLEGNQTVTPFLAPPRRAPDGIVGSTR